MTQSGEVLPEPVESSASLLVTSVIRQVTLPQVSVAFTRRRTGTSLWLGGQRTLSEARMGSSSGGVVSATTTVLEHITTLVPSSVTPKLTSLVPNPNSLVKERVTPLEALAESMTLVTEGTPLMANTSIRLLPLVS